MNQKYQIKKYKIVKKILTIVKNNNKSKKMVYKNKLKLYRKILKN